MPWKHVDAMSERLRFVRDARQRLVTFTELCARYGISRVTDYKWLERAPLQRTAQREGRNRNVRRQ